MRAVRKGDVITYKGFFFFFCMKFKPMTSHVLILIVQSKGKVENLWPVNDKTVVKEKKKEKEKINSIYK